MMDRKNTHCATKWRGRLWSFSACFFGVGGGFRSWIYYDMCQSQPWIIALTSMSCSVALELEAWAFACGPLLVLGVFTCIGQTCWVVESICQTKVWQTLYSETCQSSWMSRFSIKLSLCTWLLVPSRPRNDLKTCSGAGTKKGRLRALPSKNEGSVWKNESSLRLASSRLNLMLKLTTRNEE